MLDVAPQRVAAERLGQKVALVEGLSFYDQIVRFHAQRLG
jgi:hypothetical protein